MSDILVFKRVEKKYIITESEKAALLMLLGDRLIPDEHGESTVQSLYLDTPTYRIIRASLDARVYKEKLRVRTYGTPDRDENVFFEIKKKYKGVVYKRREKLPLSQALEFIATASPPRDTQIMRELKYALDFYGRPKPKMLVSYEREAYFVRGYPTLRLTFDSAVRYRSHELELSLGGYGRTVLPEGKYILEVKTDGAMPIWLSGALDRIGIRPSSFSKYGASYRDMLDCENTPKGVYNYV